MQTPSVSSTACKLLIAYYLSTQFNYEKKKYPLKVRKDWWPCTIFTKRQTAEHQNEHFTVYKDMEDLIPKSEEPYKPKITPEWLTVLVCVRNRDLDLVPCLGSPKYRKNIAKEPAKNSTNFCNNRISQSVCWEVLYCAVIGQIKMVSTAVTTELLLFYKSGKCWDLRNLGGGSTERLREATGCYPRSWDM